MPITHSRFFAASRIILLAGAMAFVAGCCFSFGSSQYKFSAQKSSRTTHVGVVQSIVVSTGTGNVTISEDDTVEALTVDARIRATGIDQAEADSRLKEAKVSVELIADGVLKIEPVFAKPDHGNEGADLTIRVPSLKGLALRVKTGTGDIKVTAASGTINFESGVGGITVLDSSGAATVESGVGDIRVENHNGAVDVEAGVGDVMVSLADGANSTVQVEAGVGDVALTVASGFSGTLELDAGLSELTIKDLGKQITRRATSSDGGSIDINGGGATSKLESGIGSIAITVKAPKTDS